MAMKKATEVHVGLDYKRNTDEYGLLLIGTKFREIVMNKVSLAVRITMPMPTAL